MSALPAEPAALHSHILLANAEKFSGDAANAERLLIRDLAHPPANLERGSTPADVRARAAKRAERLRAAVGE